MSGASSGDDSELEPEVPTEVPSDVEVVAWWGWGTAELPDTPTAEPEALARKQRLVLDKAYRYLLDHLTRGSVF